MKTQVLYYSYDNLIRDLVTWDLLIGQKRVRSWQLSVFASPSLPLQLHNVGPSSIGQAELQVGWPARFRDENLLYAMEIQTDGPISCQTNTSLNPQGLQVPSMFYKLMHFDKYSKTKTCEFMDILAVLEINEYT